MPKQIKYSSENWKPIPGYKGLYEISKTGRIVNIISHKEVNPTISDDGYLRCNLRNGDIVKTHRVHRLIALAFIPNPSNHPIINHKDGNKTNNTISNLEWCSHSYNHKHAYSVLGRSNGWRGLLNHPKKSTPIEQITMGGDIVKLWPSASEAERELNIKATNIRTCANGKIKSAYGFIWKHQKAVVNG